MKWHVHNVRVWYFLLYAILLTNRSTCKDRKHTREGFFRELKNIFIAAANKISEQKQMPYWDEIVDEGEAGEEIEERLSTGNQSIRR